MGLPRANKLIRATLGCGPSSTTTSSRVRDIRVQYKSHMCPADILGRMKRAARLWAPLIEKKLKNGTITRGDRIPVTSGSDATPVPAHPQYCFRRNKILGLCGPICQNHKCTLDSPELIHNGEAGFEQIVDLVRNNKWASYVYVHILRPQVYQAYALLLYYVSFHL